MPSQLAEGCFSVAPEAPGSELAEVEALKRSGVGEKWAYMALGNISLPTSQTYDSGFNTE